MIRLSVHELWARKRRLAGSLIAVFLGVSFLTGTLVLADTLSGAIDGFFKRSYQGTDVVVRNATDISDEPGTMRGMIDGSAVDRIGQVPGIAVAEPVIQGSGQLIGKDGKAIETQGPRTAGNWIGDRDLNPYHVVRGRVPRAADEVVINRKVAQDGDLRVGDRTAVLTPQRVPVTVVGISKFGDSDAFGGTSFTAFTLEGAQRYVAQRPGRVSSVSVKAAPGVSQDELAARIRPALPAGTEAITGKRLIKESIGDVNDQFISIFRTILLAFAGVALLVAAFSIHNTFAIQVAQRTRESALLRALGADRGQVVTLVAAEALLIGTVATLAGLAGGLGVAALLKALFSGFGFGLPAQGLIFATRTALIAVPVGIIVTALAALGPVLRASRVAPLAALREAAAERPRPSEARGLIGASLGAVAVGAVLWGAITGVGAVAAAGAVMCLVVMVVLAPVVAGPAASLVGRPAQRLRGVGGALARQNAMRNPHRTAGAATALMIGVGVVTLLTVFIGSVKASMQDDVAGSFHGQLVVGSAGDLASGLDQATAAELAGLPQVEAAAGMGQGKVRIGSEGKTVTVADPVQLGRVLSLDVESGTLGGFAVSAKTAKDHGWKIGSPVAITFADGSRQTVPVATVYRGDDLAGGFVLPRDVWASHTGQLTDKAVFIHLRDGVSIAAGKAAVDAKTRAQGAPAVRDRDEYIAEQTKNLDSFLGIIYGMLALAILIALLGIANTLALSVHERTRELGLLRAVGATRAQVRSMVRWESVIVAVFGTAGGIGLGVFLGWALTSASLDAFAAPSVPLVIIAIVGAVAGVLAAVRPARRAAKLNALTAISAP